MAWSASAVRSVKSRESVFGYRGARRFAHWFAYLYLLPAFTILVVFRVVPSGRAIWLSTQSGSIQKSQFVGLANYQRALTAPEFWDALKVTIYYALGTVPVTCILALGIACLLFQKIRGRAIYRTIYFMPCVISTVASATVWAWVFDPRSGLANGILRLVGLPPQQWLLESSGLLQLIGTHYRVALPSWINGPPLALVAVMVFAVWQFVGFYAVVFLSGLSSIDQEVYDAAKIDGANSLQAFRRITVPLLAPSILFVLVVSTIEAFQAFNPIYAMNRTAAQPLGGPIGATRTVAILMFKQLYEQSRPGYAAAIAVLLSGVVLVLTLVQFRFSGRRNGETE